MTRALRWPVCDNPYTLKPLLWVDDYWSAVEMVNSELGSRNLYIGEPVFRRSCQASRTPESRMTAQLISFDAERVSKYLNGVFTGYLKDPADSDYQRGFLAAALVIYREGLGRGAEDDRLTLLDAQVAA